MSTYNTHIELENAAKLILEIIKRQVNGSRDLVDKLRFVAWKEGVRVVTTVVGNPFPKWMQITHPEKANLAGHLWLQSIKECMHSTHAGTSMAPIPPTLKLKSAKPLKVASQKGKEKASAAKVEQMMSVDYHDGEGKGIDKDVEMVGDWINKDHAPGPSIMNEQAMPKLIKQEVVEEEEEDKLDGDEDVHVALDAGQPNHPVKKPCQTPAITPIPKSHPVVLIPQGRPVIHLPERPAWTTSQVLPAQPQQCLKPTHTTMPAAGPSRMPQSSMIPAHEQNATPSTCTPWSTPTPQLQPPTLFEVNVCNELNQLFFFCKSISAQMVEVKTQLNAIDSH
ncbi:hypothetical protein BKA82DRAFT_4019425 [Pisolithus tinctorius]|nr:hypothetical protein BKA82DRAFT_4019425 [Pisolithus tinctorius]